jgi:nitrous oxide reductase
MNERRREGSWTMSTSRRRFLETAALGGTAIVFAGVEGVAAHGSTPRTASRDAEAERLAAAIRRYGPEFGPRKAVR